MSGDVRNYFIFSKTRNINLKFFRRVRKILCVTAEKEKRHGGTTEIVRLVSAARGTLLTSRLTEREGEKGERVSD